MEEFLSKEIQAGLDAARLQSMRKASRLRLEAGGHVVKVLRRWKTGFANAAGGGARVTGAVARGR